MVIFNELMKDKEFRSFVEQRLASHIGDQNYQFSTRFPKLYKYRALTDFAVSDIIKEQLTASNIAEFNDLFDGQMNRYGTSAEINNRAENEWKELEDLYKKLGKEADLDQNLQYTIKSYYYRDDASRAQFTEFVGAYISCLSTKFDSILMWAHYADSSTGIYIEYDFNQLDINNVIKSSLFPVAYSKLPDNVVDLLDDENGKYFHNPIEKALLCTILNKFDIWSYESEWRMVFIREPLNTKKQRISISVNHPRSITFGYHFLRPCFLYDMGNIMEMKRSRKRFKNIIKLLQYMKENEIQAYIAVPSIGEYKLERKVVDIDKLLMFIKAEFKDNKLQTMNYYHSFHNELLKLVIVD